MRGRAKKVPYTPTPLFFAFSFFIFIFYLLLQLFFSSSVAFLGFNFTTLLCFIYCYFHLYTTCITCLMAVKDTTPPKTLILKNVAPLYTVVPFIAIYRYLGGYCSVAHKSKV